MTIGWFPAVWVVFLTGAPAAYAQSPWGPEIELGGQFVDLAVNGTTVHFVEGIGNISYRRSTDDGATWSHAVGIDSGRIHLTKIIAAREDDVWLLYLRDTITFVDECCSRTTGNLYLRRSRDGGLTWEPRVQLTTSQGAFRIHIAVSGNRVHVVWMDYRAGEWHVFYLRSTDRGTTWEPEVNLVPSVDGFGGPRPTVAVLGDLVHVVWGKKLDIPSDFSPLDSFDTYYKRSTDGGATWGPDVNLTSEITCHSLRGTVAAGPLRTVVVTWDDDRAGLPVKQFGRRSTDNGQTWGPTVPLSFVDGNHGDLVAAGAMFHTAWMQDESSTQDIFYRLSTNGGAAWGPEERVNSLDDSITSTPLLAATSRRLHVIWGDDRTGSWRTWYRARVLPSLFGDFDGDADVDLADYGAQQDCFSGPGGGLNAPECGPAFDRDQDQDVDLIDFAGFAAAFTGS